MLKKFFGCDKGMIQADDLIEAFSNKKDTKSIETEHFFITDFISSCKNSDKMFNELFPSK